MKMRRMGGLGIIISCPATSSGGRTAEVRIERRGLLYYTGEYLSTNWYAGVLCTPHTGVFPPVCRLARRTALLIIRTINYDDYK